MMVALETELEKERNAVAIATSKTMAMISRLQEEKSAMQLVAAQLQRMAEEKSEYDGHAMALLKEILFKPETEKHALEKNLIMDTLGALVLATKPPIDDILLRPLVGQKEPLVSLIGGYGHIQEALELANLMQRHVASVDGGAGLDTLVKTATRAEKRLGVINPSSSKKKSKKKEKKGRKKRRSAEDSSEDESDFDSDLDIDTN
ncbi:hypothetical protein L7F22_029026 [Adiantum nelumboides]|nr:hypothetical protein [Adiantum nelumboides]